MPKKNYNYIFNFFLVILFGLYVTNFLGCKKEAEKPVEKQAQQTQAVTQPAETTKVVEKPKVVYPDLVGKWTGTIYNRSATFNITKQDSSAFKGNLTIFFRENINQQVSGTIDPQSMKITMKDLVHNKAMGRYSGILSDDFKTMSGTFTMNSDGKNYNFNFSKK
jgi:hypothetical protein